MCSSYYGLTVMILPATLLPKLTMFCNYFVPANSFIVALVYIVMGKIVAEEVLNCKRSILYTKPLMFLCSFWFFFLLLLMVEVFLIRWLVRINDAFLFLPLFTLVGFLLLLRLKISIKDNISRVLRNMSILIYITHAFFVDLFSACNLLEKGMRSFLVILLISLLVSSLIVLLAEKIPALRKLY